MKKVEPIRELDDIERMKDFLKSKSERNYVLIMCGLYSGMRISDIIPLQVKHVTSDRIEVTEKKTGKVKRFAINPELRKALNQDRWCTYRAHWKSCSLPNFKAGS